MKRRRLTAVITAMLTMLPLVIVSAPALAEPGELEITSPNMGSVHPDTTSTAVVVISNEDDGESDEITITDVSINDPAFTVSGPADDVLSDGESTTVVVTYTPTEVGTDTATLTVSHDGTQGSIDTSLSGSGVDTTAWFRVNAGAGFLVLADDDPSWVRDTVQAPSPYVSFTIPGTPTTPGVVGSEDLDSTVPENTPFNLFNSHRFDGSPGGMTWAIPVDNGSYEARLFFAETDKTAAGERIMDISVEEHLVLDDFDVFAEVGPDTGTMRAFRVDVTDGSVDIEMSASVDNPLVSGIEVIEASTAAAVSVDPDPLTIEAVTEGTATGTVTVTNDGTAFIEVTDVTTAGADAAAFAADLGDAVWLAPGETINIDVTFDAPATAGSSMADLVVSVTGSADITSTLEGSAVEPTATNLGASKSTIDFGTVTVDENVSETVTLTNQGNAENIDISSLTIGGSDTGVFTVEGPALPMTLAPGESVDVTTVFSPTEEGSSSATLQVAHTGANSPISVDLTGTGVAEDVSPPPDAGFEDVGGSLFQREIDWLAAEGITRGCNPPDNTLFCPTDHVTRGQMAAFLHRALDDVLTPEGTTDFVDDNDSVFESDIEWLAAIGVTRGCNPPTNNQYCPNDFVTRGQMAAFLHRALDGILTPGETTDFVDDDDPVFESDIEWLAATGVTRGCNPPTNDEFCPNDFVTREQMAAFLYRALSG